MSMADRVALVTGGGSGIGRAAAAALAQEGFALVVADVDEDGGGDTVAECERVGGRAIFVHCDVSDAASTERLVEETIRQFGRLDAAFNNAGIEGLQGMTADCTPENFDRVIAVNLRGVWLCMRAEIPHMVSQGGGAIVNCASVAGLVGLASIPAYVAAKHGVVGLTRAAALEYANQGVRVNAVCPGAIETPMLDRFMSGSEGGREAMTQSEPVGRIGQPEEIADAVVWLCSRRASFVTGQAIAVDGGWTTR
jgi:NAD(P)-dependent dehydrogenase (short-subunit alcohol dehydrogenase family)